MTTTLETSTLDTQNDLALTDLYDLRYEVQEACLENAYYTVREQVLRFENILRYYSNMFELDSRYILAVYDMKLLVYRQIDFPIVQRRLLEEVRRLTLDINYLSD